MKCCPLFKKSEIKFQLLTIFFCKSIFYIYLVWQGGFLSGSNFIMQRYFFFFLKSLSNFHTQYRAWTHNPEIKSHMLRQLSQPGSPHNTKILLILPWSAPCSQNWLPPEKPHKVSSFLWCKTEKTKSGDEKITNWCLVIKSQHI